jgi:hypothetical protein
MIDPPPGSFPPVNSADTSHLQNSVLLKISDALAQGAISPAQATTLQEKLDKLNETEAWYKSLNQPIPQSLVEQNTQLLKVLSNAIEKGARPTQVATSTDALHRGIDDKISSALASNKITSEQAEVYYTRLAQIESELESLKSDPTHSGVQAPVLIRELNNLKATIRSR